MGPNFDDEMGRRQVDWRKAALPLATTNGSQNGVERDWILPRQHWQDALYAGIGKDSTNSLAAYATAGKIQPHAGVHNLKSSWVLCANLYFPFGATESGRALLSEFLRNHIDASIVTVDELELEYEHATLKPSALLGESGGGRGAGQTSPDLAFVVNGGRGLVLVENKLVEHSFYRCSARHATTKGARQGNPDPARCDNVEALLDDPIHQCHQAAWGRRYWEILGPVANRSAMAQLKRCPAASAGYQLFRQQSLAEGIAQSGDYDFVVSAVAWDERNQALRQSLRSTGLADFATWGSLFSGKSTFATFTHQQWVRFVSSSAEAVAWEDWLKYVAARYGLA
jgi:hypothetical protein